MVGFNIKRCSLNVACLPLIAADPFGSLFLSLFCMLAHSIKYKETLLPAHAPHTQTASLTKLLATSACHLDQTNRNECECTMRCRAIVQSLSLELFTFHKAKLTMQMLWLRELSAAGGF